jgi:hypothetical protein
LDYIMWSYSFIASKLTIKKIHRLDHKDKI